MDFFDVINTRKTIRKYCEITPPIEDIERIIDSARLAPSATNSQNWKFIAVYNKKLLKKMQQAVSDKYDDIISWKESKDYENKLKASKSYSLFFAEAPVVIVALEYPRFSDTSTVFKARNLPENEVYQARPDSSLLSMGAAIENISLAAHALGYGTCWMCAPIVAYKEMKKLLNIEEEVRIVSLIALGKPEKQTNSQPLKKSLNEVMEIIK